MRKTELEQWSASSALPYAEAQAISGQIRAEDGAVSVCGWSGPSTRSRAASTSWYSAWSPRAAIS